MNIRITMLAAVLVASAAAGYARDEWIYRFPGTGYEAEKYTLENGLTVYLMERHDTTGISGSVVVKAGTDRESGDCTGTADYARRMACKGTERIGSLDWEKESPIYREIIRLYDTLRTETGEMERERLQYRIDSLTEEQQRYGDGRELDRLMAYFGFRETRYIEATRHERTTFSSTFHPSDIGKWLELNSERFIRPVFRNFNSEVEKACAEYNERMSDTDETKKLFMNSYVYRGTPYGYDVQGMPDDIRNPSLSEIIGFYNKWYVANNMALILVGDFEVEEVKPMISRTFGRLKAGDISENVEYGLSEFPNTTVIRADVGGDLAECHWWYPGYDRMDESELNMGVFTNAALNNWYRTGILDRLGMDEYGYSNGCARAYAEPETRRLIRRNMTHVTAIPSVTADGLAYADERDVYKAVSEELETLRDMPDGLLSATKGVAITTQRYMTTGAIEQMAILFAADFVYGRDIESYALNDSVYRDISKEDVARFAGEYYTGDHLTFVFNDGGIKIRPSKLPVRRLVASGASVDGMSAYARTLMSEPELQVELSADTSYAALLDMPLYENVNLHYYKQAVEGSGLFSIMLRYGAGWAYIPDLYYAAGMLGVCGIPGMGWYDLHLKLAEYGALYTIWNRPDNMYVVIYGAEENLDSVLPLMSRVLLTPKFDEVRLHNGKLATLMASINEKNDPTDVTYALKEKAAYGDSSMFFLRPSPSEWHALGGAGNVGQGVRPIGESDLISALHEAFGYELDIYYIGDKPVDEVIRAAKALPLQAEIKARRHNAGRKIRGCESTKAYFYNITGQARATVQLYMPFPEPTDTADDVREQALGVYLDNMVKDEAGRRLFLARNVSARIVTDGDKPYLYCRMDVMPEEVGDAADILLGLTETLPENEGQFVSVKRRQERLYASYPLYWQPVEMVYDWLKWRYPEAPPMKSWLQKIRALEYEDMAGYYDMKLKGKPATILINGDRRLIDMKSVKARCGKVRTLYSKDIFN